MPMLGLLARSGLKPHDAYNTRPCQNEPAEEQIANDFETKVILD